MGGIAGMLVQGGPVIWVLLAMSLGSGALIVVRGLVLRGSLSGGAARAAALETWAAGDRAGARAALAGGRSPADRMLAHAMDSLARGVPRGAVESDLVWRGNAELARLGRHLRVLDLVAMTGPLLGLLGTVLGMIVAFQTLALAEGAANAGMLAGGIWQALLTTAAGLLVAIPAAVAASLFGARIEAVAQDIESAVGRLFAIEEARAAPGA
jgi:biopolymer transport protein ExbB